MDNFVVVSLDPGFPDVEILSSQDALLYFVGPLNYRGGVADPCVPSFGHDREVVASSCSPF
jgi:hypothetical protein